MTKIKHTFTSAALSGLLLIGTCLPAARAAVEVSVDFFHDNLESYGEWREVGDYGYCWQPRDVDADWRPYRDGRWLYTDAGWTWDSEEPYSWAVYHYGRWANIDRVGWVWVPGTEWGPAWVSWRRSPGHVGWAPLPPEAQFSRTSGFGSRVDADFDIGPANYSFVEVRHFGAPRLRTVIIEPRQNITIIRQTTNITRISYVNNVVYNEGPRYEVISRESEQPIRRLRLERREGFDGDPRSARPEQFRASMDGDAWRVTAPQFGGKPRTAPRKVGARVEKAEVDRGWKNAGSPAEVMQLRTKIKAEPATAAEPPPQAKTAASPVESTVPAPEPGKKAMKGKTSKGAQPASPAPVPAEAIPTEPKKAATTDRPEKQPMRPPAPIPAEAAPTKPEKAVAIDEPTEPKRAAGKSRPAAPLSAQAPKKMPKGKQGEPAGKLPPASATTPQPIKRPAKADRPPQPDRPDARKIESKLPGQPESRPTQGKKREASRPPAPVATEPRAPQPAEGKGKGKSKEKGEKDDALKPAPR